MRQGPRFFALSARGAGRLSGGAAAAGTHGRKKAQKAGPGRLPGAGLLCCQLIFLATTTKRPFSTWFEQVERVSRVSPYSAVTPVSYSASALTLET